ncbi:MAG: ABC transporter permease [Rhodothermales bacterium]
MIRHAFLIALRSLRRDPLTSIINIGGLALGIAAAFVLGLYVRQELSYDRHVEGGDRVYRIATDFFNMGGFAKSQQQLLDILPDLVPEIEAATRFDRGFQETTVQVGETRYAEPAYIYADSAFFDLFSYRFLEGTPGQVMRAPDEIVLSETAARTYFGDAPALGRVVLVGKERKPHRVTGVVADPPYRTHLAASLWLPLVREDEPASAWSNVQFYNYVRLREGSDPAALQRGLDRLLRDYAFPSSGVDGTYEQWASSDFAVRFMIQPLRDIYLHSDYRLEIKPGGNPVQVYVLGIIGAFILVLAAINYINLTTAAGAIRAKEVGVKKTLGAEPNALRRQFVAETVALSGMALVVALVFAQLLLRVFSYVTGAELVDSLFDGPLYLLWLVGFTLAVGLAAGVYPALFLARFRPVSMLHGTGAGPGNSRLRSALVVTQFAVAITLGIGSLVVFRQLDHLRSTDKGFAFEGVVDIENAGVLGPRLETFRDQVDRLSTVAQTSLARRVPTGSGVSMFTYKTPEMPEEMTLQTFRGDDTYLPTLGLRLIAGRNFSRDLASDSSAAILNEAAVRALNLGDDPIGKDIGEGRRVVGVVSDFYFQSLSQRIEPAVVLYNEEGTHLLVRLQAGRVGEAMAQVQALWASFAGDETLRYAFIDDNFAKMAEQERVLSRAVASFTFLALFIACLGLFGLTAFGVQRRRKEIGIRKVLGASALRLTALLTLDFLKLVGMGFLVAVPIAYLAMARWLDGYANRIVLGPGVFLAAGGMALLIAAGTVAWLAVRAASADPVKSLRYE